MSLPPLTLIRAGAGSGKTYTIEQRLGAWVAAGEVAPERIAAVTFTEAAAAELRDRIGTRLLALGRIDDALRLDQAYISTIHGFGLRILTEFAFEAGVSPEPRLLDEDEEDTLLRLALARTDKADEITSDLGAFGYGYDYVSKKSPEEVFRDDLLRVVALLRAVGGRVAIDAYAREAGAWIAARYGPTAADGERLGAALRANVQALLAAYPQSLAREYGNSQTARDALQRDFRNLHRALAGDALASDWQLWKSLRELRLSKRGAALPEDYDALARAVMAAADALPHHPGPLGHARMHVEALLGAGAEVLVHYAAAKREAGLVDYVDMIAMAGRLLREHPAVLRALAARIDCLVIDEFQDTNPLQFVLLWQLTAAGVPTLVVGDLKQAIMGFQGADPRLFDALERQHRDASEPLTRNWRSQPGLMAFVNALGPGLFGAEYVALEPQRKESGLAPLEVIAFAKRPRAKAHEVRAAAVGDRLRTLLADPAQRIADRRSGTLRGLRGSDLAVLCPTHAMLATYAEVLRAQGLRVRLQAGGWFASRAVQIAWHALAYLANGADRHAALYLAVTELGSLHLHEALRQLMEDGRIDEPLLRRLDGLAEGTAERTIYTLVSDTLGALGLFDTVAHWPDGEQARANLLRLLAEAAEFMDANREALASGGFHGAGVQTFRAWLAARVEASDEQPDPRVLDEDAIVLATWHGSKGREWPVVAVCGLDRAVTARLPNVELGYASFGDLSRLLDYARIEYAPDFAATETNERFLDELQRTAEIEARRLLYVVLTRARDKVVLEWPEYLSGKESATYWAILCGACDLALGTETMAVGEREFACVCTRAGAELPADLDPDGAPGEPPLPIIGRRAIRPGAAPAALTPESRRPSESPAGGATLDPGALRIEPCGTALEPAVGLSGAALGTFLHRCFEVLGPRPDLAPRIARVTGVAVELDAAAEIAAAVARFEAWLADRFHPEAILREWPLLSLDERGSVVAGAADLIVKTNRGVWVIDHKSDPIDDPRQAFLRYQAQLQSYADALAAEGHTVLGIAIHWIRRGEIVSQQLR